MPIRRSRSILLVAAVAFAAVAGTYLFGRLRAPFVAVRVEQPVDASVPEYDGTLRIGCYNIAHGRGGQLGTSNFQGSSAGERRQRLEAIGALLREYELDLVVLNEVDFSSLWSSHVDQARLIADAAGLPNIVRQRNVDVRIPFARLQFGNAILSRYPLRTAELIRLVPRSRLGRILVGSKESVIAHVDLPGGTSFAVGAIHLDSRDAETRRASARAIIEHSANLDTALVLAGDFNSEPAASAAAAPTAIDLINGTARFAFPPAGADADAPTFPSVAPDRCIDRILTPRSWTVINGAVIESMLSDHRPVMVEVRVAE